MATPTPSYASSTYRESSSTTGSSSEYGGWAPSVAPGDVSTAVRNLLESTQRLQDTLRAWSVEKASEDDVSNLYVQIGHEFNDTIAAFAYHQIDLSDIHCIPSDLRMVLERCLAEEPCPEVFELYVPKLRKVLYKLLKGLQNRQEKWRTAMQRSQPHHSRTNSDDYDSRSAYMR